MAAEGTVRAFRRPVLNSPGEVVLAGKGIAVRVGVDEAVGGRVQQGKVLAQCPAVAELEDRLRVGREFVKVVDENRIGDVVQDERLDVLVEPGAGDSYVYVHFDRFF